MKSIIENKIPVIAVVGPTASGKTELAIKIAKRFNGEIVSADSMQIYSELSIGTAKPTTEEMGGITHYLVGFLGINEEYSVANYVEDARKAIDLITQKGKTPIICGGTGLYVDSLLTNTEFSEIKSSMDIRKRLFAFAEENGNEAIFEKLKEIDPETAGKLHYNNLSRIVRALEVYEVTGKTISEHQKNSRLIPSPYDVCYIGTNFRNREKLYSQVEKRIDTMLDRGLVNEARFLFENSKQGTAAQAIGYKEFYPYFYGEMELEEAIDILKKETRHYAKRQLTWFRKNEKINWIYWDDYDSKDEAYETVFKILEKHWRKNEK